MRVPVSVYELRIVFPDKISRCKNTSSFFLLVSTFLLLLLLNRIFAQSIMFSGHHASSLEVYFKGRAVHSELNLSPPSDWQMSFSQLID